MLPICQKNPLRSSAEGLHLIIDSITSAIDLHRPTVLSVLRWAVEQDLCKREGQGKKGDPFRYSLPQANSVFLFTPYINEQNEQNPKEDLNNDNSLSYSVQKISEQKQNGLNSILPQNDFPSDLREIEI